MDYTPITVKVIKTNENGTLMQVGHREAHELFVVKDGKAKQLVGERKELITQHG